MIFDVVHNHWGPFDLADYDFDGWNTTNFPGGVYFYDEVASTGDREGSPWDQRPDYSYPITQNYISGQIDMWFDEYHADGLRWDSVSNIYNAWGGAWATTPTPESPACRCPMV